MNSKAKPRVKERLRKMRKRTGKTLTGSAEYVAVRDEIGEAILILQEDRKWANSRVSSLRHREREQETKEKNKKK